MYVCLLVCLYVPAPVLRCLHKLSRILKGAAHSQRAAILARRIFAHVLRAKVLHLHCGIVLECANIEHIHLYSIPNGLIMFHTRTRHLLHTVLLLRYTIGKRWHTLERVCTTYYTLYALCSSPGATQIVCAVVRRPPARWAH